jgi:radical SAM protein with 4Fe4S-binding SPASM domain
MPFCYSPWTNIDISPSGDITPCCKFQKKYYDRIYNIQQDSIYDYMNSNLLQNVKLDFEKQQWPVGCERCKIEEQNGIDSKRNLDWDRWQEYYKKFDLNDPNFITASIAFGNTCNLKCITCGSHSSSRWQQEYREIYNVFYPHVKFYKKDFIEKFIELAPGLIHLDIPGGEPFLSGVEEQKALLHYYIDQNRANQITLHYTTNATVFPDNSWWNLWSHFKEIDLQLSIDGIHDRYEYIRFPAEWQQVVNNIQKYIDQNQSRTNFRLSVSHTVSAYNILYLDEFFNWCYNIGLPRPWLGRVHNPSHMRPTVWPEAVRKFIANQLQKSQHSDVQVWSELILNNNDSKYFTEFKQRLQQHDQHRGLDFKKTFPEMAPYL